VTTTNVTRSERPLVPTPVATAIGPAVAAAAPAPAAAPVAATGPIVAAMPLGGVLGAQVTLAPKAARKSVARPAASPGPRPRGGVLGAHATLRPKPATAAAMHVLAAAPAATPTSHGPLGTVAAVADTRLPFTGLRLWTALLAGAGPLAGGLLLRRRLHAG
jgi:hypothetical protein